MSLLRSFLAAPRVVPEIAHSRQRSFIPQRVAGVVVDYETALKYSAVWRCVNLISSTIAMLPWHVFEMSLRGERVIRRQVEMNHPVDWALHREANPEMSALHFRQFMIAWALLDGNAYAEIARDRAGRVQELWPIAPDRVTPNRDTESGGLRYSVRNQRGDDVQIPARDMYHLKGLGFDGLVGYSVIAMAARSIGLGLAMEQFGASYFENGINPSGVLQHPKNLGQDAYDRLKQSLKEEHSGGLHNQRNPLILEESMTWQSISAKPEEAQFLENRRFNVGDVARWFGVPMVLLEEKDASMWGSGIEQILIAFDKFGLSPWVARSESEADIKLFGPQQRGRLIAKMNMNALLRGDLTTRMNWYKAMRDLGVFSANDILELEDRNPIGPEGDKRLVPLNMTTLEKAGEDPPKPEPAPPMRPNEDGDDDEGTRDADGEPSEEPSEPMRARVVAAQRETIEAAMCQIVAYQKKKWELPRARYRGHRRAFLQWMDKFFAAQIGHMRSTLTAPVNALVQLTNARVHVETVIESFIDRHIELSRLALLDAFDNEAPLVLPEPKIAVEHLIEATLCR
ncbi:MAG TPA: phage portal protein [Burkholderiales bacterium]